MSGGMRRKGVRVCPQQKGAAVSGGVMFNTFMGIRERAGREKTLVIVEDTIQMGGRRLYGGLESHQRGVLIHQIQTEWCLSSTEEGVQDRGCDSYSCGVHWAK
jgi:hypothetical protein